MREFSYTRARTPQQAREALNGGGEKFIAGGTNLLDLMKLQVETPSHLIDINHTGLDKIEALEDGGLRIGALVRNSDLAADQRVRKNYEVLSRALLSGASAQLRNKATTGGNLLQRTRCYYFYDTTKPCNKRAPGSGCAALEGYNRVHAVLGTSRQCIASHPSDMAVAMRVLDAVVETIKPDGEARQIPIAELHTLPGETPHIETTLEHGELITAVSLPPPPPGTQIYRKIRDRASYAFAMVSVAAILDVKNNEVTAGKMAFGGIGAKPWRDEAAESLLQGGAPAGEAFSDEILGQATGHGDNDFKIPLTRRSIRAVIAQATGKASPHGI